VGGRGSSGGGVTYKMTPNNLNGGKVTAHKGGKEIGFIDWFTPIGGAPQVMGVEVDKNHRRKGIGRELYKRAARAAGGTLEHSKMRTNDGEKFARGVGGHMPARVDPGLD
jgi:GNAT superfamily N-acetyltransferase